MAVSELYSLQDNSDDPVRVLNIRVLDPLSLKQLRRSRNVTFEHVNFLFSPAELFRTLNDQLEHLAIISCEFTDPANTALSQLIRQQQETAAKSQRASTAAVSFSSG